MIIEFKTARNTNGHRYYLRIDTERKTFTREPHFIAEGIEIRQRDLRELTDKVRKDGYQEI